jgi:hypothetical protein
MAPICRIPCLSVIVERPTPQKIFATLVSAQRFRGGLMNKFLIATSIIAVSTASTRAADLGSRPYTGAPVIFTGYDWSGFYIGANGGEAVGRNCWSNTVFLGVATIPSFVEG